MTYFYDTTYLASSFFSSQFFSISCGLLISSWYPLETNYQLETTGRPSTLCMLQELFTANLLQKLWYGCSSSTTEWTNCVVIEEHLQYYSSTASVSCENHLNRVDVITFFCSKRRSKRKAFDDLPSLCIPICVYQLWRQVCKVLSGFAPPCADCLCTPPEL